jgi:3-dehydroquinate synthase
MKEPKSYFTLGGNKHPVFVAEDLKIFSKAWRWRIGTHATVDVFIVIDKNIQQLYPTLIQEIFEKLPVRVIETFCIDATEDHKSWHTLTELLQLLFTHSFDKKAVLVGIGGGIVSDITGFTASIIKRGLRLVLIPTSLLAMTDAAIGGKNGVNFQHLKNQLGTIYIPHFVFVYIPFLQTLPQEHLQSGYAEMLKHALIADVNLLKNFRKQFYPEFPPINWLCQSIRIKLRITKKDTYEERWRKLLNFGHTFGHAFESYFAETGNPITHGYAVALGMHEEIYLSTQLITTASSKLSEASNFIKTHYPLLHVPSWDSLEKYLLHDKKRSSEKIDLILLENIGKPVIKSIPVSTLKLLHEQYRLL